MVFGQKKNTKNNPGVQHQEVRPWRKQKHEEVKKNALLWFKVTVAAYHSVPEGGHREISEGVKLKAFNLAKINVNCVYSITDNYYEF